MLTPIDALAFCLSMVLTGAPVAGIAAVAKKGGQIQRKRRQELARDPAPLLIEDTSMVLETDYSKIVLPDQEAKHAEWISHARAVAILIARDRGHVSSDDLWERCPPPSGVDPRVMAAAFAERAIWEMAGYVKSRRKINHGRTIAEWRLKIAV